MNRVNTTKIAKNTKDKAKNRTILSIIPVNKNITMLTSILKSQKTSYGLGNFYVNNWKEKGRKIRMAILHLIFHNFQRLNKNFIRLKK